MYILASEAAVQFEGIVLKTHLVNAVKKLSARTQTSSLEAFHSVVIQFAPKHTHFSYLGMNARYINDECFIITFLVMLLLF